MAVSKRVRFDVFKRDEFTCQYCGRKTPDVVLEIDHVIPRAEGGRDEIENLISACVDCNRGKGARPLEGRSPAPDLGAQAALIREREEQIRAYHDAMAERDSRRERDFEQAWNYWFEVWGVTELERYYTPGKKALSDYVERLGIGEVKDAIDITNAKFRWRPTTNAVRYLFGVLKRKQLRLEGLIVPCTICGKDVLLDPGDDPKAGWFHTACKRGGDDG